MLGRDIFNHCMLESCCPVKNLDIELVTLLHPGFHNVTSNHWSITSIQEYTW